jgi:hypothetical protein
MQHPSLIERSVGATLRAYLDRQLTPEEAEFDLVELIATQIFGKTDYAVAVIGYYVRNMLKGLSNGKIGFVQAFESLVDAALIASDGNTPVSSCLANALRSPDSLNPKVASA